MTDRAKILIISAVFPPEPVVSALLSKDIADELSKNHKILVICPQPTRPAGFDFNNNYLTNNYEVINLNSYTCAKSKLIGRLRESYSFGRHCSDFIHQNKNQIKCIYLNTWPLFAQYLVIKTAKKNNIKTIIHIQDIYPESLTNKLPKFAKTLIIKILYPIDKFILKNATKIIAISSSMIDYLSISRKIDSKKFELVRNWQDELNFSTTKNINEMSEDFIFMFVGSISPSAGVMTLINSFNNANLDNSKLIIAGNGSDKENCISRARLLNNKNIEFVNVNSNEVSDLQSKSDVLLLPLKKGIAKTATPSKLTAYLLSGKPIIACVEKESDVSRIIEDGCCGYVVEPEDEEGLTNLMRKVKNEDREMLKIKGDAGMKYASSHFSKTVNLDKLIHVIESTIE